jgi:hypothetical protein
LNQNFSNRYGEFATAVGRTSRDEGRAPFPKLPAKIRRLKRLLLVLGFLGLLLSGNSAHAGPIFITRGILIHPIYTPSVTDTGGFLTRTGMWGGVQRGLGSTEERFGWLLDVGAAVELYQWQSSSLLAVSGMQLNADTRNEISFNPSGVTWEEHLVYATRGSSLNWQLGFAQRCRHDVDNLDIKEATGEAQQRTLIYSSISGKLVPSLLTLSNAIHLRSWFSGDLYVISQDYRLPKSTSSVLPNVERLAWSAGGNAELGSSNKHAIGAYLNIALHLSAFGDTTGILRKFSTIDRLHLDARIETGIMISGRGGNFRLFAGFDELSDDGAMPTPERNNYFFIGFRITGRDMFN